MIVTITSIFTLFLLLSLVAEPLSRRLRLPYQSMLILLGALTGYGLTQGLGIDTGLRADSFHDLVFYVLLPILIFHAAFNISFDQLSANLTPILVLAIVGMLLTTLIASVLLYTGIGHASGFPWIAALLAGALLAATDPVAVIARMKALGAPERLEVLLEGESLFNDATAIVTFSILLGLALMPTAGFSIADAVVEFMIVFSGGVLIGFIVGWFAIRLSRYARSNLHATVITLAAAYGSFLIAEAGLDFSGIMAALVAGLMLGGARSGMDKITDEVEFFWQSVTYLANGAVFLLMGFTITVAMFADRWLAMLIAIGAVLVARLVSTFGSLFVMNRYFLQEPIPLSYQPVVFWGGLRGVVAIALALSLPAELPYWYTIQAMAFGVVLFTMFVQAPATPWLLRRSGLVETPQD